MWPEVSKVTFVASFWRKCSTRFYFIIKIKFIMILILYQVLQVTLWPEVGKVTVLAGFWYKSSTTFHNTTEIFSSFIVVLSLHQMFQVILWLEVGKVTFLASFCCKKLNHLSFQCGDHFHSGFDSVPGASGHFVAQVHCG